ncbi:PepSY-like domain-containing protein [Haloflavibacter putidus]|uniref:Putative beta-lactamase-inhibitor-like PepSY-like domain-containing protein n=1 Tax=Haloflavibacter putidus TaxID=2576776 RepID=A0A507ZVH7_9FLAO|nr:PepSY-like domain-containing protein [Haloflavibacter putidus]TQD40611.1 hypothetical protein FKR84_01135 [Haloflavibacter putidus]
MKRLGISFLLVFFVGTLYGTAQDLNPKEVPSVVVNTFKKEFPKASDVEWELTTNDVYEVEFEIGYFTEYEAWFDANGKMIKYTEELSKSDLPKIVKEYVKTNHASYHIDDAEKIVEGNTTHFKIEIEDGPNEQHLLFDEKGKIKK